MKDMQDTDQLRHLTSKDLATLGMQDIAYIKQIVTNEEETYGIYAADGTQMAVMSDRSVAFAAVRQNDLEPVSVH